MRESLDMEQVEDWLRKARFAYKAQVGHCVFIVDENGNVQAETIVKVWYVATENQTTHL